VKDSTPLQTQLAQFSTINKAEVCQRNESALAGGLEWNQVRMDSWGVVTHT